MEAIIWIVVIGIIVFKSVKKSKQIEKDAKRQAQKIAAKQAKRAVQKQTEDLLTKAKRNVTEDFGAESGTQKNPTTVTKPAKKKAAPKKNTSPSTPSAPVVSEPQKAPSVVIQPTEESDNILASVEDLMVKGPDTGLTFERDFLSEGLDMVNQYY